MPKILKKGQERKNNMAQKKDSQSNKYQLTINNPIEKGYTHEKIFETLRSNFKTLNYCCMADEQGSTFHTHIFVVFDSRVRFSMVQKHFPGGHIESCKGTVTDNITYIKKSGKWQDDIKHGTQVEGSFIEYGTPPPDSKGKRGDMTELYQMVSDGLSNAEILAINQDYILNIDKIDKVRTTLLTEKFKGIFRIDLRVIYVWGETASGKTSGVLQEHGCENVYRVTDYLHPFDGYTCQPILVFDEFRSSLRIREMLNYCDIYPLELPARFNNKYACYNVVYIISNWSLEKQYPEIQEGDRETWQAFLRRIHKVKVFTKEKVTTYDSVEDYLKRHEKFHKLSKEEQQRLPFK